jgi:two-component sensor histidine kinase
MYIRLKKVNQALTEKNDAIEDKNLVIDAALKEKENLLKEIHHRVKNNLQIISSLLNLQSHQLADENAKLALDESKNKIQAIALVHQKLYQSENYTSVELINYLKELADHQQNMYANDQLPVKISVEGESMNVNTDVAVPLGLIFTELITNSFKHAFTGIKEPEITISLTQNQDCCEMTFSDNGCGLPSNFSFELSETLGMEIIKALSEQISGSASYQSLDGANFKINFSAAL